MRVRAPHGACPPVEHEAHRALLARPLGVEVHKDDLLLYLCHVPVGDDKGVVCVVVQCEAAEEIQHAHIAKGRGVHVYALARALGAEVRGAQYPAALLKIRAKLRARPGVVAKRDDVRPGAEQCVCLLGRDADDVGVLPVDDGEADAVLCLEVLQALFQKLKAGFAADVADGQNFYAHSLSSVDEVFILFFMFLIVPHFTCVNQRILCT